MFCFVMENEPNKSEGVAEFIGCVASPITIKKSILSLLGKLIEQLLGLRCGVFLAGFLFSQNAGVVVVFCWQGPLFSVDNTSIL